MQKCKPYGRDYSIGDVDAEIARNEWRRAGPKRNRLRQNPWPEFKNKNLISNIALGGAEITLRARVESEFAQSPATPGR